MEEEKPDVDTSMMISLFSKKDSRNIITDLAKIRIEEYEDKVRVVTNIDRDKLNIKSGEALLLAFGITNDPYSQWSLDWGHIGTFKLGIRQEDSIILPDKFLIGECKLKNYVKQMNVPDRRMDELPQ